MKNEEILKENDGKKFDIVLMNPPYAKGLGEKFLIKCIDISNKIISIQPANFLIGNKKNKELINKLQKTYYNITREKDASEAFYKVGAVIGGDTAIHYINNTKDQKFILDNKEIDINKLDDIRKYSGDNLIEEFNDIIKPLYEKDNIVNHLKNYEANEHSDNDDWCIKISRIRGHKGKGQGKEDPDFYTIISNNDKFLYSDTIGQYKNMINTRGIQSGFRFYISFNSKNELNNFVNYIKSDFARTALYLLKTSPNVISGRICRRIPWFDFSDEHFSKSPREIDDWLFKKYNISDEIRKHIEEILPDYYSIRGNIDDVDGNGYYDVNDFLKMNNEEILKENNGKKFDILLSNPPYNNGLGNTFLEKYLNIGNKIITIQPLSWLIAKQQKQKITKIIDNNCDVYIDQLNGIKEFTDAGIIGDCAIQYINTNKKGKIRIYGKEYDKCSDIKQWSSNDSLETFIEHLGEVNNSLWDNIKGTTHWDKGYEPNPNDEWWCIKIQKIRGNVNRNKNEKQSPDFYTLISNNEDFIKNNKGQYKTLKQTPNKKGSLEFLYFAFNTEQELNNFIRYIKTDFVRACLMLVKKGANLHRGELRYIPWFDFSDEHFSKSPREIDDWLFKKYNINDEIRKHIEEILPDYYHIRK